MGKDVLVVFPAGYFEENFEETPPSKWYIINALGESVWIRKRSRADAQRICDEEYGKGKYIVRASKIGGVRGEVTAK